MHELFDAYWQNPPNAPIFVNIPTAAVWYIIKKASANFRKRTVLYRVPRMGDGQRKGTHLFCSTLLGVKRKTCLTVVGRCDRMKLMLVWRINRHFEVLYFMSIYEVCPTLENEKFIIR